MSNESVLIGEDIRKGYSRGSLQFDILRGIDVRIQAGESVAIMGPSGAGKSTLLQILGAMSVPDNGSVKILGLSTKELSDHQLSGLRRQKLGFIFQSFNLLPSLSAVENVAWPLLLDGRSYHEALISAETLLEQVGLLKRKTHLPSELSGGEQQRVAIARALVASPKIIFADEPTGALDSESGRMVLDLLHSMRLQHGCSLIMVTHDKQVASSCDRLIELKDGKIQH